MSDNPNSQTVIELAIRFRDALERRDVQALNRLIQAYKGIYGRLIDNIDALALEIVQNEVTTPTQLYRMDRYKRLIAQTADELNKYQALTGAEMDAAAQLGIELGERQARTMMAAALTGRADARIVAVFHKLPTEAITQLLGFLDPAGPLAARLGEMTKVTTERVAQALVEAVAKGYNPRKTAQILQSQYGMTLTDSLRMTRTVQLYSYRESSRASYLANSDVLSGWQWHAHLDGLTCMSCIAQHGSIHPMTETLNDHHNGRCAMLPITKEFGAHLDEKAGQKWFEGLSEEEQKRMMGKGVYQAWRDGGHDFSSLSVEREDAVYGKMRTAAPLWDFLGAEPPVKK